MTEQTTMNHGAPDAAATMANGASARVPHLTVAERAARGKAARAEAPRASHDVLELSADRDPIALLEADVALRIPELVPVRRGRMLVSAFTFYRGAAGIMAHDLAPTPRAGLRAQLCGDAHLSNFGGFASPDRALVFDLNDFDETLPGPFEWDVKRLATSFEICGRDRGFSKSTRRTAVLAVVRAYREAMQRFASMDTLAVWYSRLDSAAISARLDAAGNRDRKAARTVDRTLAKALTKDSMKALTKLVRVVDGEPRIISSPPLIVPIDELVGDDVGATEIAEEIHSLFRYYRGTLQHDRRTLLEGYRVVDVARKVVGVGSVGTRAWMLFLLGRDGNDPLFLQIKEAGASVLSPYLGGSEFESNAQRVVEGQRMMQAASDILLGWLHVEKGLDGRSRDFYVRQLWDWKTSADLDLILPRGLELYAGICGWTLARAHARSGDRIAMASYLGNRDVFDRATAAFAEAYADQNERDYRAFREAVKSGQLEATTGI